jgi:mRNA interferase YafQ
MRRIDWGNQFKRDFKRESKGQHRTALDDALFPIIELLALDQILEARFRDHALSGNWSGHRDCHIKPDLILIYQKPEANSIQLVRLGSHSELGI